MTGRNPVAGPCAAVRGRIDGPRLPGTGGPSMDAMGGAMGKDRSRGGGRRMSAACAVT